MNYVLYCKAISFKFYCCVTLLTTIYHLTIFKLVEYTVILCIFTQESWILFTVQSVGGFKEKVVLNKVVSSEELKKKKKKDLLHLKYAV